jgi:hypothetical protein
MPADIAAFACARYAGCVEAFDRDWLRANRHRIRLGATEDGRPTFDFSEDNELFDTMDDFLDEDCVGPGEHFILRHWDNPTGHETHEIVFADRRLTSSDLEAVLASI